MTATTTINPVLKGAWLKPGAHVNATGSPRPTWRELDDEAMASVVMVDSREAALEESGDVIRSGARIHVEAGEITGGSKSIRASDATVFKSAGLAIEGLAAPRLVYDAARARGSREATGAR